jgi:hypothetical protein
MVLISFAGIDGGNAVALLEIVLALVVVAQREQSLIFE